MKQALAPDKRKVLERLAQIIPQGAFCLGCRYLGEDDSKCSYLDKVVDGKECGINEAEGGE